jgi:ADP-heptose:LPS heptosyltransferase
MKTFVYHDGALGDTLLSLPCLKRLKACSGWVHVVGRGDVVRFLRDAGVVDAAASSDQALFASLHSAIDPRLRTFLSGFDRVCVFTAEEYPAAAAAIRAAIPHSRTIRTIPPDGSQMHAAQYRFSQLEPGALLSDGYAVLRVPPEKANAARSLLCKAGHSPGTGLIAVHPGSGGRLKCWPLERYFNLIERLQSVNDAFVILFTGDAEDGEPRKTVCRYARGRKNMLHAADLELMSAASLLSHCGLYIGNDSGFSHLAGILGCTAIVLFGPTDPLQWKPLGPRVEVVSTDSFGPMTQITVDDVIAKTESAINGNWPNH